MTRSLFPVAMMSLSCTIVLLTVAEPARAGDLPADERAFLEKHMSDVVSVTPKPVDDADVKRVIVAPVYNLTITIKSGDGGTMTQSQMAAHVGDKLVPLSRPGTDQDCPEILKMIRPDFRLKGDADARELQAAFNAMFPPVMDDEKKAIAFHHSGHDWQFVRGKFFDKAMGFVVTTDGDGKITAVTYSLKLS